MKQKERRTMKELPLSERPYEKVLENGSASLSDAELLAVILRSGARGVPAKELAELFLRYRAKMYMPFHMDVIYRRWGKERTEAYFREVGEWVEKLAPGRTFLFPDAWRWYRVGMCAEEE